MQTYDDDRNIHFAFIAYQHVCLTGLHAFSSHEMKMEIYKAKSTKSNCILIGHKNLDKESSSNTKK